MDDLKSLEEDFNASTAQIAPEAVCLNWKTLVSDQDITRKHLVERIEKITGEVKSLTEIVCPE
jgi:hypothetical protein